MNKNTKLYKYVINRLTRPREGIIGNTRPDVAESIRKASKAGWRGGYATHRYMSDRETYVKQARRALNVEALLGDSSRKTYDLEGKLRRKIPVYEFSKKSIKG